MTDWIAHYKAVKARIYNAPPAPTKQQLAEQKKRHIEEQKEKYNQAIAEIFQDYKELNKSRIILVDVAKRHGMTVAEMKSKSRKKSFVLARQEAMYLLKKQGLSYPLISRLVGVSDHTTSLHGANVHAKRHGLEL